VPRDAAYGRKWLRGRDVQVMIFIKWETHKIMGVPL